MLSPRLIIEIFEHINYSGKKATVFGSIPHTQEIGMHDMISSIKIYKGPGFAAAPNYKVIFHEHINYQGQQLILPPGFYPSIHTIPYNFGDKISSISFSPTFAPTSPEYGAVPLIMEAYRDIDFKGLKSLILRDVSYTKDIGANDDISSVRITRGPNFPFSGCRVLLFEHANYEGRILSVELTSREFEKSINNLHEHPQRFGGIISSVKILPMGVFDVLVVVGDRLSVEPAILGGIRELERNCFNFNVVKINPNPANRGDPTAVKLSTIDLSRFDIIWFTWNAAAHDREYFMSDAEKAIKDFVKKGGVVWMSAMDDNIIEGKGWKGDWIPVDKHPIKVVNSSDVNVTATDEGKKTGLFSWPNKVDLNDIVIDDHWVTTDSVYTVLAKRNDNGDPVGIQLRWGDGHYVGFAIDTRDAAKGAAAKPLVENALCYLTSLAWQTSPKQPLRSRRSTV